MEKEYKIGEAFLFGKPKIMLKVIKQNGCVGCVGYDILSKYRCIDLPPCCISERQDGKNVIFKKVE